jgi:hypothetical protein
MSKKVKHAFDKFLNKIISRKLLVWLSATAIFAFTNHLKSGDWVVISAIYIGGQTVIDAVVAMKGNSKMSSSVSTTVKTVLGDQKKKDETGKVSATAKPSEDSITK